MNDDYSDPHQYLYVEAVSFVDSDRKRPVSKWVSDCPDGIDPRSEDNPHTLTYDETDPKKPYVIVGLRDAFFQDVDIDVGPEHDIIFEGDVDAIDVPDGALAFFSPTGGLHILIKLEDDHASVSGVSGVDIQGDTSSALGVVTSPFHHPDYEIINEPDESVFYDDEIENETINDAFGTPLLEFDGRITAAATDAPDASDSTSPTSLDDARELKRSSTYNDEFLDVADIDDALDHIDPNITYPEWRNIGFALVDFCDNRYEAEGLFTAWSRRGSKWDDDAQRLADDIISNASSAGTGDATIGTVIKHARDGGWTLPSAVETASFTSNTTDDDETGGSGDFRSAVSALMGDVEDATALETKREQLDRETDLAESFAETHADTLYDNKSAVGRVAGILAEGAFYNKTEAKDLVGRIANENARVDADRLTFDAIVADPDRLPTVVKTGTTDHTQDSEYEFLFRDGVVETNATGNGTTHNHPYSFLDEYKAATDNHPAEPSPDLRDAEEWYTFIHNIIRQRLDINVVPGVRTGAVHDLQNYITRSEGISDLSATRTRDAVFMEQPPDEAAEVWVQNKHINRICDNHGIENTSPFSRELRHRGHISKQRTKASHTVTVDGQQKTFWILDASFAVPESYNENPNDIVRDNFPQPGGDDAAE